MYVTYDMNGMTLNDIYSQVIIVLVVDHVVVIETAASNAGKCQRYIFLDKLTHFAPIPLNVEPFVMLFKVQFVKKVNSIGCRLLEVLDEFMSKLDWLIFQEAFVEFIRPNFELYTKLRTWKEHDKGVHYQPQVRC